MGKILNYNRREIAKERMRFFFYEIAIIFLLIFGIMISEWILLPLIVNQNTLLFGMLFYYIRALAIALVIIIFLYISNKKSTLSSQLAEKELKLHIAYLKLYNMTKKNYSYQLLYGLLLFFLILIPIEFLISIFLPNTIPSLAISLAIKKENSFLLIDNFALFLLLSVVIQFSISFTEETIFRGLITKRGSEHFNNMSAVMISTLYFAFIEIFLNPVIMTISYYSGIMWFIKSFIIGLVLSLTIIRRKWLFPLIIAKTFDSIISSVIFWDFLRDGNYTQLLISIYCPLLIISLIILIVQRSRVKESLQIGKNMIKSYFRNEEKLEESSGDKVFRIIFDIFFAFLLFLFGILISV
ncbi:MAG: CPBP family intramembrane glutamic endopeptidase [Promethearchaeota archaeon]